MNSDEVLDSVVQMRRCCAMGLRAHCYCIYMYLYAYIYMYLYVSTLIATVLRQVKKCMSLELFRCMLMKLYEASWC